VRYFRCSCIVVFVACLLSGTPSNAESVPFIYSTDLFHPPDDPDDHVDLATLFALPELDVRAVVLDLGRSQLARPGGIPVKQLNALTGRNVPHAAGLAHPLRYPEDTGEYQHVGLEGVELILRVLRESSQKVVIMTVGSLRDVAAAYNRDAQLLRQKVARLYVNAGHSRGALMEWNTGLDPQAYLRIMRSDLPVFWVPAFESHEWLKKLRAHELGTAPHQSYWSFRQSDIYDSLPRSLQNYFLYALGRVSPSVTEPLAYLQGPQDQSLRDREWKLIRNMWCTAAFYHAASRKLYRRRDEWVASQTPLDGYQSFSLFEFVPARVLIDSELRTTLEFATRGSPFTVLLINDVKNYSQAMLTSLRRLLKDMPIIAPYRD